VLAFQRVIIGVSLVTATEVGNLQNKTFVESVHTIQESTPVKGDICSIYGILPRLKEYIKQYA